MRRCLWVLEVGGGVLILGFGGALLGGFAPPWSKDSRQHAVPTHFRIRGNTLVQVVEHRSGRFSYPVVADPFLGINLTSSARWARHPQGLTLEVDRLVPIARRRLPGVFG